MLRRFDDTRDGAMEYAHPGEWKPRVVWGIAIFSAICIVGCMLTVLQLMQTWHAAQSMALMQMPVIELVPRY